MAKREKETKENEEKEVIVMPSELNAKIIGLLMLCGLMLSFTYLFIQAGESMIPLILFFISIISALALVSILYKAKK